MAGVSISFEADISSLMAELPKWQADRIPSITRNALNDTIEDARYAEMGKIRGVFDRPRPITERSPLFRKATKETLTAEVYIRDEGAGRRPPARYLLPQVVGGPRPATGFEVALRRRGILMPGEFIIPAIGVKRDAYGNLPRGLITRIMSQLQLFTAAGFSANETKRSRKRNPGRVRYFVPAGAKAERGISRLPRGIYERRGNKIRGVVMFVRQPVYRKRYDMGQATIAKAQRVFAPYWQREFYRELKKHQSRG